MLTQATGNLIAAVRDDSSNEADRQAATQSFFKAMGGTSIGEANDAISTLADFFVSLDDPSRAAHLALICGALVERGCDPLAMAQPLGTRLKSLLQASAVLADACRARTPTAEDIDQDQAFEDVRRQIAPTMPIESMAWAALSQFWRPAIAVYSASAPARAGARGLRDLAVKISDHHDAGHWLRLILSVLDNEPILAIEPQTGLGILARISGVVDNFQLNVLLMDGFPKSGIFAPRRISKRVADVARGIGPQQTEEHVTGVWNLYTWRAIRPDYMLPDPKDHGASSSWIWNEGIPEDIPLFEGRRVILLGPPSYSRGWRCQRIFNKLPADLECECRLSKGEVSDWLARMVSANGAS